MNDHLRGGSRGRPRDVIGLVDSHTGMLPVCNLYRSGAMQQQRHRHVHWQHTLWQVESCNSDVCNSVVCNML